MAHDLKKDLQHWANKIGRKEAEKRLCIAGVSWSMAAKLLAGIYKSEMGELHKNAIRKAMEQK